MKKGEGKYYNYLNNNYIIRGIFMNSLRSQYLRSITLKREDVSLHDQSHEEAFFSTFLLRSQKNAQIS
jgi:hypothetical protein